MAAVASSQADASRRIEELRTRFDRLRTERIRAESEVERLSKELAEARADCVARFGTDDEDEIRRTIEADRAENDRRIEAFRLLVEDIETRLSRLGGAA